MINVFQPALGEEELEAVARAFRSNWVGKGDVTSQFEAAFAQHLGVGSRQVRSVASCTEGLFQIAELLGWGAGDEVVLPTISFVGAGNAVAHTGARPVFCDVDPRTLNATVEHIEACLTPRTRAILLLHYGGLPADMDPILELAARKKIGVIEDSACSVASRYRGRICGTLGDYAVWSFDAMKTLVTGDGGMIYCRREEEAQRVEEGTYLGLGCKSGLASSQSVKGRWWEFEISSFGRRAIMNDIASSIGLVQLRKLRGFIDRRRRIHERYRSELRKLSWITTPPDVPSDCESSYYFYWIQTPPEVRDSLAVHLKEAGIYSTFRYFPLHEVKRYGFQGRLPNAEAAARRTLCIPLHHALSDDDVGKVVESLARFHRT